MLTTIRKLLEKNGIEQDCSVYRDMEEDILDYPITLGEFVETVPFEKMVEESGILKEASRLFRKQLHSSGEYGRCKKELEEVSQCLKEKETAMEERIRLKEVKKHLMKRMKEIRGAQKERLRAELGYNWEEFLGLCYKNTVIFTDIKDLRKRLPVLENIALEDMEHIPLFVSGLEKLEKAVGQAETVGMVGGPCLFGVDEVFIYLDMKDGQRVSFDSSCGRRCLNEKKTEYSLREYIERYSEEISDIVIENKKDGVTRQEYDSILYLFCAASALKAKVVIPLPDMSYFKYMKSDLEGLREEQREKVLAVFQKECYQIADMYLEIIESIACLYPEVEYQVMHDRNQELLELFYEKREPYISNSSYMQKITNKDGKKDAVIDYITMLALPYYVYGTEYIVQLDSIDETDSGRKCGKIHKKDIKITQILYPESLSRDGKNTIYNAPLEYKDYIRRKG